MSSSRFSGRARPGRPHAFGIFLIAAALLAVGFSIEHSSGYVGATRKNGFGCVCHAPSASPGVQLRIVGPSSVMAGTNADYTLEMTGGPAVMGGFNVAAGFGALSSADTTSYADLGELTHAEPKAFVNDTVRWLFVYRAPADRASDTIYSTGNSVNGDGVPNGDAWNFGPSFPVEITPGAGVVDGQPLPATLSLDSYPNPFNPSTTFACTFASGGRVSLNLYDVNGRKAAEIFDGGVQPGQLRFRWDAAGMAGGIYIAVLRRGDAAAVRKVLLLK